MALLFICPTRGERYEVEMTFPLRNLYTYEGKKIELKSPDDDCQKCKEELDQISESAREKARELLRQKKLSS
jgi:hypothetical protein